jgi:hypothetical protein
VGINTGKSITLFMPDETIEGDSLEKVISSHPVDALLDILVDLSRTTGLGFPVILFVKGTIISGNIISFEMYMERIATNFRDTATYKTKQDLGMDQKAFQEITESIVRSIDLLKTSWTPKADETSALIHLENVRMFNPIMGVTTLNGLWRGHLDSIDGFIFGALE